MPRTLVSLTTYNEIDNLPALVAEIFRHAPTVDVLVVDDNSPDGTGEWVRRQSLADPRLHLLARPGKLGQGSAVIAGLQAAIERGYDLAISMDADFSHHPRYLPELIACVDQTGADVVIGSRYVSGGGVEGWPLRRRLMSRAVNLYARLLLGLATRDCSGGFRCYRVERIAPFDFRAMISTGYSFHEEMLWRLKRFGCRFAETPITFVDRVKGESKINAYEAWTAVRVIFKLGWQDFWRRS